MLSSFVGELWNTVGLYIYIYYNIVYKPRDMWSICNRNYGIHRTLNNERIERNLLTYLRKMCTKNE